MLDMNTTLPMVDIIGYLAALCMVCGYMPQAIYTIRTRNTDSIALPTFLLMGFGALFFCDSGRNDRQSSPCHNKPYHIGLLRHHNLHKGL